MNETSVLPGTAITLAQARSTLSGLHFAKESLSKGEREVLYIAEALLRLVDAQALAAGDSRDLSGPLARLRDLTLRPGVSAVDIYDDGVEVVGGLGDSDESAGFIAGDFSAEAVRTAVGPHLAVVDHR